MSKQLNTVDAFRFLSTGQGRDALNLVEDLVAEGVISYKSVVHPEEDPADRAIRQKADMTEVVTTVLSNGAGAFRMALATQLLKVVESGEYAMTSGAIEARDVRRPSDLLDLYLDTTFAADGLGQAQMSRLRQFLVYTLPTLKDAGVEITEEHVAAIINEGGDISISRAIRTIGTHAKQSKGKIEKEQAQYMADVIAGKVPATERDVKVNLGMSLDPAPLIHGISKITDGGTTIIFENLTDDQVGVIVSRLRGFADCEGWDV